MPAVRRFGLVGALAALVLAGCGGEPRREIRQDVVANRAPQAEQKINALYRHHLAEYGERGAQVGNSRHLLLWRLERATVDALQGEWGLALAHLREAARVARENRTRSAARAVGAAVINDNLLRWTGEPFELARIPYYAMFAELALAQRRAGTLRDAAPTAPAAKGALAERGAVEDAAVHRDRAASAAIALEEQLRRIADGQEGATRWTQHGWLHAAAAAVRLATAATADDRQAAALYADRARIAYERAGGVPKAVEAIIARANGAAGAPAGHGSVLVVEEVGFVPKRDALTVWVVVGAPPRGAYVDLGGVFVYVDDPNPDLLDGLEAFPLPGPIIRGLSGGQFGVFGCEVPVMPMRGPRPGTGSLSVDQGPPLALDPVEDVEAAARICFDDRKARRIVAIIARTAGKLIAARQGIGAATQGHDSPEARALKEIAWLFSSALVTASEQADTRCWTLLPNRVAAQLVDVPVGMRSLSVIAADGRARHLGQIDVRPGVLSVVMVRSFPEGVDHIGGGQ